MLEFLNITTDTFMQFGIIFKDIAEIMENLPTIEYPNLPWYIHAAKETVSVFTEMVVGSTKETIKIIDVVGNAIYQTPMVKYPSMVVARVVEVLAGWKTIDEAFADLPQYWKLRVAEDLVQYKDAFKHIILK